MDIDRAVNVRPFLPPARGPVSTVVVDALRRQPGPIDIRVPAVADPLIDDDLHLALYCLYELHYEGFSGVDERWEWEPEALALRQQLEAMFLTALREAVEPAASGIDVRQALLDITTSGGGRSLSGYLESDGSLSEMREFGIHRSAYQLKEADPHTWAIPRLRGAAKAAMVKIQSDEYGEGNAADMHAELFAATMRGLDLDATYGAYLGVVPGFTLATVNLVTLLGLHRSLRGALVGHLAVFEMTSEGPMGRYARALERLGAPSSARRFYEVHVEADAIHKHIALDDMVAGLVAAEPQLGPDIVFGARALTLVERTFTDHLLDSWGTGRSSLLPDAARVAA